MDQMQEEERDLLLGRMKTFMDEYDQGRYTGPDVTVKPDGSFDISSIEKAWRVADLMYMAENLPGDYYLIKRKGQTDKAVPKRVALSKAVATFYRGQEIGIKPMQCPGCMILFRGHTRIWGDMPKALALKSGLIEDFNEEPIGPKPDPDGKDLGRFDDEFGWRVTIKRSDHEHPTIVVFTMGDARTANIIKGTTWYTHTARMLLYKARGFAIRDSIPEALTGFDFAAADEYEDAIDIDGQPGATGDVDEDDGGEPASTPDELSDRMERNRQKREGKAEDKPVEDDPPKTKGEEFIDDLDPKPDPKPKAKAKTKTKPKTKPATEPDPEPFLEVEEATDPEPEDAELLF